MSSFKKIMLAATAVVMLSTSPSFAYYDTRDNPEYIEIQPNQSAFAIPVVGDTKNTQVAFGSKNFLDASKVATKRFQVTHSLIKMPGITQADMYVPSVKLILVDRTPYMREWVDASDRGTSSKKQGFQMQSKEGINIGAGVSIAAIIKEEDAATFLYWFGTKTPNLNPSDPASNFQSVSYGKSLDEICDTVVRGYVQAALSNAYMNGSFIEDNANASKIMEAIRKDVVTHFAEKGITIDYIGYSGPLDYTPEIQKAIDDTFTSTMQAQKAINLLPSMPYFQAQAEVNVKNAQAEAIKKWNGVIPTLPSWFLGTGDFFDKVMMYFSNGGTSTKKS